MDKRAPEVSNPIVFDAYSTYYDLLYRDKDYEREATYIANILHRYGVSATELLEFGSGTGRHGRLLAERGFRITGVERSATMVAKAQQTNGFVCQQGDITTVHLGRTFDAVLSLFHVISYQTTNEEVQSVFARASEHLKTGGLFVFDIWYSPAVGAMRPETRIKRIANESVEIVRIAEPVIIPNSNRVDVCYQIFVKNPNTGSIEELQERHSMRHFSLPELTLFGQLNGMQLIGAEEFLTGSPPGESTWGVCVIFRKRPS